MSTTETTDPIESLRKAESADLDGFKLKKDHVSLKGEGGSFRLFDHDRGYSLKFTAVNRSNAGNYELYVKRSDFHKSATICRDLPRMIKHVLDRIAEETSE